MSNIKAAILVGGPLDGKSIEVSVTMHGYLQAPYDRPQLEFGFDKPVTPSMDVLPVRIATYKETNDGTHWHYCGG